jgi:cytochrome P450
MKPVEDWSTDFDHLEWRWVENPQAIWGDLRPTCPVAHTERYGGVYLPLRHADICAIANDPAHFSSRSVVVRNFASPQYSNPPINSDPPEHAEHRRLLLPAFGPEAIRRLEPRTRTVCRETLDDLRERTHCDAATGYARHIPSRVIAIMLGLPEGDGDLFLRWIYQTLDAGAVDATAGNAALVEMTDYLSRCVAERRRAPADDLISYLLAEGSERVALSEEHIVGTLRLLLLAGIDTTWSTISVGLLHLASHEADRTLLAQRPALIESAVEEFLRAYSPVTMARLVARDHEMAGTTFRAGQMVLLPFAAANRDPDVFGSPDRVILDRAANRHVAFGFGRHRCIGAGLARMEIRVALEEWLAQFPSFRRDYAWPIVWSKGTVRGPRTVPLLLG